MISSIYFPSECDKSFLLITDPSKASQLIRLRVENELKKVPEEIRALVEDKLIDPEKIALYTDLHCIEKEKYWLLTDFKDYRQTGHRLIYFEEMNRFGLAVKLKDGRHCCLGFYNSIDEAIISM